uniref:beta-N-acetylhexosaminidase n=1 Tax=uncultured Draconibacterium sp. TaxID=1573823 RepID=UPI0032174B90
MNNKLRVLIIAVVAGFMASCTTYECPEQPIEIIPYPNQLQVGEGCVNLAKGFQVVGETTHSAYLSSELSKQGIEAGKGAKIVFNEAEQANNLGEEGYRLTAKKKTITIEANGEKGQFYGIQTLLQMVNGATVAAVEIEDVPAFGWRAYMLDESRYFHGETFVKQVLDQMAKLKMNVFHWHLVDDAGWRIEIKKYPLLTEVGGTRSDSEIETWKSGKTAGVPHSGFYTQDQIRDIVKYAAERNITIVPEFEMPGHSSAAIAAYTWLGTAGKDIDVPVKFGRHYDNYDVTKPEVEQFVKDVLNELFELFPSEVIHIGGDEVGYKVWEESKHVQKYMKENGINTPADLQIAFTNKISKFIESKGRRMMGWNEIMGINIHKGFEEKKHDKEAETELAKNVVVHFWKGDIKLITDAAQKGYSIVNSLHSNTYLDYTYKNINLEKAYSFNPIPADLDEKYHKNIFGLGCQMWSEWTPTNKDVERQTYPRIAAYAETGWTKKENKDYARFRKSMDNLTKSWDGLNINYGPLDKVE